MSCSRKQASDSAVCRSPQLTYHSQLCINIIIYTSANYNVLGQSSITLWAAQVDKFNPVQLADVLSAYANMVHHPGPLIAPLNERLLPKLDTMDAGQPFFVLPWKLRCRWAWSVSHGT